MQLQKCLCPTHTVHACACVQIADLGLATCQSWSKLTKEESRNKSRLGQRTCGTTAGTLSYMAPEHLNSIHARSSEKSDVYSFAIVVWVVLTRKQPYESLYLLPLMCFYSSYLNQLVKFSLTLNMWVIHKAGFPS